jgi:hypothetical protein
MTEYYDRPVDEPHPPEDRPVAGWPRHDAEEHTESTPAGEEPLVGEVWNEESSDSTAGRDEEHAGYRTGTGTFGQHEQAGETADPVEAERTGEPGEGHAGEPFGTEEPTVVTEPATETEATAEAEPAVETEHTEEEPAAEPVAAGEPLTEAESADAVEPVAVAEPDSVPAAETETEPTAEPVVEGARPTAADELTVDTLLEPEAADRFRDRWRDVKAAFVDDPADAGRQAGALSGEAVEELTAALGRLRRKLDEHWEEGESTDTERLRVALRGYGSLIDRILAR